MTFQARLKAANLKAATTKFTKDGEALDVPAALTIQLVVEAPAPDVLALVSQLASEGRDIEVELSSYQMGF